MGNKYDLHCRLCFSDDIFIFFDEPIFCNTCLSRDADVIIKSSGNNSIIREKSLFISKEKMRELKIDKLIDNNNSDKK